MPWGLDEAEVMYLFCAERYHWTSREVDDQPLAVYVYLPVLWQVIEHMQADHARRQGNGL